MGTKGGQESWLPAPTDEGNGDDDIDLSQRSCHTASISPAIPASNSSSQ
jgi:hypothetical protein